MAWILQAGAYSAPAKRLSFMEPAAARTGSRRHKQRHLSAAPRRICSDHERAHHPDPCPRRPGRTAAPPAQGTPGHRRGAGRGRRRARRRAAAARPADRAPARDPGPLRLPVAPHHLAALAAGNAPGAGRGVRGRDLLSPLRRRARKATARPPALTVRVCDGLSCEMAGAQDLLAQPARPARRGRARHPRALHRPLRAGAGGGGRPEPGAAAPPPTRCSSRSRQATIATSPSRLRRP